MCIRDSSHADYPAYIKHNGNNDYRGGGNFSGRPVSYTHLTGMPDLSKRGISARLSPKLISSSFFISA